jgi:imidazolonepropionase-like amidohydrolase
VASVNPASEHFPVVRANGITSAITMPSGTVIGGQSALIHLDGWTWEEMAVQPYAALDLRFSIIQSGSGRSGGSSSRTPQLSYAERKRNYEKQMAELREFFENARRYQSAKRAGAAGFKTDVKFEAMLPVLEGKTPVVVHAARERAIKEALQFAVKEKIRIILAEPREALALVKELKVNDVAVIVPPTLSAPAQEDDPYDKTFTLPGELYKAGVKIVFGSFGNQFARNLPYQAAAAVAFGLPYEAALKALTLDAAEIWGLGSEYGSIEKGKWADLMVTDGDPLEHRTNVKYVFIKGKSVDLASKHQRLYQKYIERP